LTAGRRKPHINNDDNCEDPQNSVLMGIFDWKNLIKLQTISKQFPHYPLTSSRKEMRFMSPNFNVSDS
jgi:hypothetical protein